MALAWRDAARAATLAAQAGIPKNFARWDELIADTSIDAVAIATPPLVQRDIAVQALRSGKAVFAEKPLAADMAGAEAIARAATASGRPFAIDFEFAELPAWRQAKSLLEDGALGMLRHVMVTWNVENYATRMRLKNWKTSGAEGGGTLGNLVSHCLYYLEHFCGPMRDMSARLFGLPNESPPSESSVALSGRFSSGAAFFLSMSAASYLGSGHRIEFYGEDGTLVLSNSTTDYMNGFALFHARRPAETLERIAVPDPDPGRYGDSRIAPVSRLASRFLDAIERGTTPMPGIREGLRVQQLIAAARQSHSAGGAAVGVEP